MLNIYIINIENDKNKLDNIIEKINNQEVNLMKVNPIFIEKKKIFTLKTYSIYVIYSVQMFKKIMV